MCTPTLGLSAAFSLSITFALPLTLPLITAKDQHIRLLSLPLPSKTLLMSPTDHCNTSNLICLDNRLDISFTLKSMRYTSLPDALDNLIMNDAFHCVIRSTCFHSCYHRCTALCLSLSPCYLVSSSMSFESISTTATTTTTTTAAAAAASALEDFYFLLSAVDSVKFAFNRCLVKS